MDRTLPNQGSYFSRFILSRSIQFAEGRCLYTIWCIAAMTWACPLQITFEPDSWGLNFRVFMFNSENRQTFKLAKVSRYTSSQHGCINSSLCYIVVVVVVHVLSFLYSLVNNYKPIHTLKVGVSVAVKPLF